MPSTAAIPENSRTRPRASSRGGAWDFPGKVTRSPTASRATTDRLLQP